MKKLYVSNKDESVRMFKNDFLEWFTHIHWMTPMVLYTPVIVYFLYQGVMVEDAGWLTMMGGFAGGVLAWTFTEYFLHRFIFHYHPTSALGKQLHFMMHGVHHDYPNDSTRLVMPPLISIPLAFLFYNLFAYFLTPAWLYPAFSGLVLGYVVYDTLHYALHHLDYHGKWWIALKTHHLKHHFKDPDKGYGVTSPLWDVIVGSNFEKKRKVGSKEDVGSDRA